MNSNINRKTVSVQKAVEMYFKEITFYVDHHFLDQELLEVYEYLKEIGLNIAMKYEYSKGIRLTYTLTPPKTNDNGLFKTLESGFKRFKTDSLELRMIFGGPTQQLYLSWLLNYYKSVFKENEKFIAMIKDRAKQITNCIDEIAT